MTKRIYIDVREPAEFKQGHVINALNIPLGDIVANTPAVRNLDKDIEYILYCRTGARSGTAMRIFKSHGFKNVSNATNQKSIEF